MAEKSLSGSAETKTRAAMSATPKLAYRPEFDGIRGFFVLVILGCHYGLPAKGGWLAVDMFFVLSGYLITSLLTTEQRRTGRLNLKRFYRNRAYRLAPALLIGTALAVPVMVAFPDDPMMGGFSPTEVVLAVLGYAANWFNVISQPALGPLKHTWSLSIEEQFYLLWPLVLIFFFRRSWSPRRRMQWCGVAILVVVVSRLALFFVLPHDQLWFATTSRADALMIGAFMAFLHEARPAAVTAGFRPWVGWTAVGLLLVGSVTIPEYSPSMVAGGLTLIALVTAVLLASLVEGRLLTRLLTWRVWIAIGRVSYGLYVYHFVVLYSVRRFDPDPSPRRWAMIIGLTALLTVGSWFLVEKPLARRKAKPRLPKIESVTS